MLREGGSFFAIVWLVEARCPLPLPFLSRREHLPVSADTDAPKDVEEQCKALCERNHNVSVTRPPRVACLSSNCPVQITAAKDNKLAKGVVISGATGPNASSINGFFDPTSERLPRAPTAL